MDHEDLIEKIFDGLDDDYKALFDTIESRDTPISFDELHEKLINRELSLQQSHHFLSYSPVTANVTSGCHKRGSRSSSSRLSWRPTQSNPYPLSSTQVGHGPLQNSPPRPYLGKCQGCRTQGYTVTKYPLFQLIPANNASLTTPRSSTSPSNRYSQW